MCDPKIQKQSVTEKQWAYYYQSKWMKVTKYQIDDLVIFEEGLWLDDSIDLCPTEKC